MALEEQKGLEQERKSLSRERETLKTEKSATRKSIEQDVIDQNDYEKSAKQLQTANQKYAQQLYQLGISEKEIQSVTDNRNFFQKILNLKENQGLITGTMALLGRPAEAAQGILAASAQGGDVLKYAWDGLYGNKEYSLKDIGIDLGNPLMNAMANMAFEAGADPFNFINLPWRTLFTKGSKLAKNVNEKIALWASRSPEGQAIYNAFQDKWIAATDFFKRIFGTWADPDYKEFANDMANISAESIKEQNTYQLLLKQNLQNVEDLDQHLFESITGANGKSISVGDLQDLEDTLKLDKSTISNLRSGEASLMEQGRVDLFNKLSTYLSEKFESMFKHGWSMSDMLERVSSEGLIEPAAKFADAAREGQAYKTLEKVMGWAMQSNPKYANYALEDLIEVVEYSRVRTHLGQALKDAAGNDITTAALHKQGYVIRLTEEGKQVLTPWMNKIKANMLMQRAMDGAHLTKEQQYLNDLISNKVLRLKASNSESVQFVNNVKHLYKNVTGKELLVYGRNIAAEGVYEVRFAPNQEVYDYVKDLNKQRETIRSAKVRYDRILAKHKRLQEPIIEINTQIAELSKGIQQDLLLNQNQIIPTDIKRWEAITEQLQNDIYGPLADIMRERQKNNPDAIFLKEPIEGDALKVAWGRGQEGFATWVEAMQGYAKETGETISDLGGLKLDRSKAQAKGSKYSIPVDLDFSKLNQTEVVNVIGYCYTRGLIDGSDLAAAGITSWNKLTAQAAQGILNKVITKRSFIVLGQATNVRYKDFINLSEWITNDMIYSGHDIVALANDVWESILSGRLTSDDTIVEMASLFGQDQMWSWMYENADNLTQMTADKIEAVKVLQNERAKFQQALYDYEKANDVERVQVLRDTMVSGVYQGSGKTEMSRVVEDLYAYHSIEDIDLELSSRIYFQEQTSYDLVRQISRIDDDLAKSFQRTWNAKKYQPVAEFFRLGEKVTLDTPVMNQLLEHIQKGTTTKPYYAVRFENGTIQFSDIKPVGAPYGSYIVLDNTATHELYNYFAAFGKKRDLQKELTTINDNIVELQMVQHMRRYPDTKYNYETLTNLIEEEYARWANEVNTTLLAQIKPNFQTPEVANHVKQQETIIKEAKVEVERLDKAIADETARNAAEKKEFKDQQAKELKKKEAADKSSKTKDSKKVDKLNKELADLEAEQKTLKDEWEDLKQKAKDQAKKDDITYSHWADDTVYDKATDTHNPKYTPEELASMKKELDDARKELWIEADKKGKEYVAKEEEVKKKKAKVKQEQANITAKQAARKDNIQLFRSQQREALAKFEEEQKRVIDKLLSERNKYKTAINDAEAILDRISNKQQWFDTKPVKGMLEELDETLYDNAATYANPLSQADIAAKNEQYIKPMLHNLELVKNLLSPEKSIQAYTNAVKNLPDAFVSEVNRFINVQEALWQNIAGNFRKHFGIDMDGWNVQGYLRHMLTPEMASFQAIEHTLNEKYTGIMSQVFGKNMKKIALAREYQASAAEVNRMMVDDLFNTNPIQVTAIALDILPENFLIGNTFKHMLDNKLITEVDLTARALDLKGLTALQERLGAELELLDKAKKPTPHQITRKAELENLIQKAENYKTKLAEQKEFAVNNPAYKWDPETVKKNQERINNSIKELDSKIAQSKEAGTKELTKQLQEKKKNLKQELEDMNAQIDPEVQRQRVEIEEELAHLVPELAREQAKGFSRADSWLRDSKQFNKKVTTRGPKGDYLTESKQFGKEWMWVDNSTLEEMERAMDTLSHAATPEELAKAPWGQHFNDLRKGIESGKHYAIHKGAFEYIKRYSRAAKVQDGNQLWATLQRFVVAPFKRLSTLSVGFHVRNLFTNYANAYLAGFSPMDMHAEMTKVNKELKIFEEITGHLDRLLATGNWRTADEQAELIRMLLDKGVKYTDIETKAVIDIAYNADYRWIFDDYMDMASRGVIGNNMFSRDLIQMMGKLRDAAYGRFTQINLSELQSTTQLISERIRKVTEKSFQISKRLDDQAKVALYRLAKSEKYQHLAKDMGFDGDVSKAAEKYVKFVLFDYNNLTRAEENVMKTLFPFYTWARKNLEFQLKNFFGAGGTRTKRYKMLSDALQGWKQGMANEDEYPDYTEAYIPIWNDGGTITYVKFNTPWSDVDNVLQGDGIVNMLTPVIKTPLEMITGYDFFTHKQFNTHGVMPGFGLGLNSITRTFDVAMKSIFQNYAPTWEDKKLAGAIGKKILDAVELAKHVFSFGSSVRDDGLVSSLGALLPSVFTSSNIQQTLYFNAKERQEQLRKAMSYYLDFNE